MKRNLLILAGVLAFTTFSIGQTTILDFEEAATSTDFQFFGGNLEGILSTVIDNPDASGINTSAKVVEFKKASDAPVWGGGFTEPNPTTAVDLTVSDEVCLDVHMDHIGNVALKLEDTPTGMNWILTQANTVMGAWERLCYDVTLPSIEDPVDPAAGHVYARVVLFLDFGTEGSGTETVAYIDNIAVSGSVNTNDLNKANNLFEMNPTLVNDHALITFKQTNADERQVSVVSSVGKVLLQQTIDATVPSHEIQAADWAPGMYMVQVRQGKNVEVVKFMVH